MININVFQYGKNLGTIQIVVYAGENNDEHINNVFSFCKLLKTFLFDRISGLRAPPSRSLEGALYKYPE